jgi:hypothetical protein
VNTFASSPPSYGDWLPRSGCLSPFSPLSPFSLIRRPSTFPLFSFTPQSGSPGFVRLIGCDEAGIGDPMPESPELSARRTRCGDA